MTEWDVGRVFYSTTVATDDLRPDSGDTPQIITRKFKEFIRNFMDGKTYTYRQQLLHNYNSDYYFLEVNVEDLTAFDANLSNDMQNDPAKYIPLFEEAARQAVVTFRAKDSNNEELDDIPNIQIGLKCNKRPLQIRQLDATHIGKLVCVPGIVINASRTKAKATEAFIQCTHCKSSRMLPVRPGFSSVMLPRRCDRTPLPGEQACPLDPFSIIPDRCRFVDQQTMKLQEAPENVPTGEMPRHIILSADRYMVERAAPGTRITVVAVYDIFQGSGRTGGGGGGGTHAVAIRHPYLRVLGISHNHEIGSGRASMVFDAEEEQQYVQMSKDPQIYEKIARSIDPAIFGVADIKKALACQLFGGSRKELPDGVKRRGDINVLLLGDPSTAKSQLLKFIEKVAPIGVYTSGKGSSAAGLTASVIKDAQGDFYLEGGSMVLADGGIVCIDEFDKMNQHDRVAIHEAMEQQTISIAKAGITTVLNSRTSVLAAANPIHGRYDTDIAAEEQIDFQTTILSRFDMIFIVKDVRDEARDQTLARHVLSIHMHRGGSGGGGSVPAMGGRDIEPEIDLNLLKRYIAYCRSKCTPRLSPEAAEILSNFYVKVRAGRKEFGGKGPTIPITVRQLEAIIRISESLAKMSLSSTANSAHVNEAINLFKLSTMDAIAQGVGNETLTEEQKKATAQIEEQIRKKLAIGAKDSVEGLYRFFKARKFQRQDVQRAICAMAQRRELQFIQQRAAVIRKK